MYEELNKIAPGNKSIEFIKKRISDDKYRGDVSRQHTVYDLKKIKIILEELYNASNGKLLHIRTEDLSKRPNNSPDEYDYARFVNNVSLKVGNDTQDTIRKNIFPEIHRMNLIIRYDKNKIATDPYKQTPVVFVSLSEMGKRLIGENNIINQQFIWSKALDTKSKGLFDIVAEVLKNDTFNIGYITKWEFMFFISAINTNTTFSITKDECINLIKEWRQLSRFQKDAVIIELRDKMKPDNFKGNKTDKRDFHNWRNKIDRIFEELNQTVYFEIQGNSKDTEKCYLATKIKTKQGEEVEVRRRSLSAKADYFKKHKIEKSTGFELHHIVALSFAESLEEYMLFDNWKNLLYIDAFSHANITQTSNRKIYLSFQRNNDIVLSDYKDDRISLECNKNVIYNTDKKDCMQKYNKELTEEIKNN